MNPVLMTLNQINDQKEYHKTCRTDLVDIFKMVFKLADSGFFKNFLYQVGVKSTVSWVFEDLKFKISEDYDQNWCFPDCAQLAVSV